MTITPSKLRENLFKLLDQLLETGEILEVKRKGKIIKIVPPKKESKLEKIVPKQVTKGDPEEFVHLDWSHEWKPFI